MSYTSFGDHTADNKLKWPWARHSDVMRKETNENTDFHLFLSVFYRLWHHNNILNNLVGENTFFLW